MKASQIKVLNELLQDEGFKGKKALRHLIWLNTTKPEFNVGDCFVVSERGHTVYGYPVMNFKAKVIEIRSWRDEEMYHYTLEAEVTCGDKTTTTRINQTEYQLGRAEKCSDNKNRLGEPKSEYSDELAL